MIDPYLSQTRAQRHGAFSSWLGRLFDQVFFAFERLAARNYDAPWTEEEAARRQHRVSHLNWR
jgi:hypothetical protein